jgi:hypothetical protein
MRRKMRGFLFVREKFESLRYRKSRARVQVFLFHSYEVSGFILDPEMGILIVNLFYFCRLLSKQDRQCVYKSSIQANYSNYYYSGSAFIITYSKYASVVLGIQHAPCYIVICGPFGGSTVIFLIISLTTRFLEKNLLKVKYGSWFSLQRTSEIFLILRKVQHDIITYVA